MIGSVLGKYRIEAELSRGGMGAVYRARHELIDRPVAVKLLRPELTTNEDLVNRFMKEAKAASAIRHPSIIEIIDFGYTDDGQAYLVMELLDGEPLSKRIKSRGTLPERDAARIVRSIAGALSAAHAKNIIHRDLKPDNVFLVPDPDLGERAKVLDFGIAKLTDQGGQATLTGAFLGTPLYMAPEQARQANAIDHRADLYSLGCIFYELISGKPPFTGEGAGELIAYHMLEAPPPLASRAPSVSPEVERIVMRLLEKEPQDRFATAADLSNALATVFGDDVVPSASLSLPRAQRTAITATAAPAPSLATTRDTIRPRNTMPLIAAGVTLAIAGVVTALLLLTGGKDHTPAAATEPVPSPPPPRVEVVRPVEAPVEPPPAPVNVERPRKPPPPPPKRPRPKGPVTEQGSPYETTL